PAWQYVSVAMFEPIAWVIEIVPPVSATKPGHVATPCAGRIVTTASLVPWMSRRPCTWTVAPAAPWMVVPAATVTVTPASICTLRVIETVPDQLWSAWISPEMPPPGFEPEPEPGSLPLPPPGSPSVPTVHAANRRDRPARAGRARVDML